MEGLALGDEDFFPPSRIHTPGDPILVVLRHNGGASESTSPGSTWTRRSGGKSGWIPWGSDLTPPPCEADDEEDDYPDGVQLQTEASLH
ncbi:Hypothetical protein FKW44_014383 [Caligus rogercresseyi]|uniref:Uncharacterized protein n=1 Tax=Caligus rogercresseyi TaxID=217165 RepID=A0A7T8GYX5_CALRO|nr:Hypothetical protein FKW44_014383 [Caligus rogercresseyi]